MKAISILGNTLSSEESDRKTILGLVAMREKIGKSKSADEQIRLFCEIRLNKNAILAKAAGADEVVVTNVEVGKLVFK